MASPPLGRAHPLEMRLDVPPEANTHVDLLELPGSRRLEPQQEGTCVTGRSGSPAPGSPSGSAVGLNRLPRGLPGWFPLLPWTQPPHGLFCLPEPGFRAPPPATQLSFCALCRTLPLAPAGPASLRPSQGQVTPPRPLALPSGGVCAPAVSPASSTAACGSHLHTQVTCSRVVRLLPFVFV